MCRIGLKAMNSIQYPSTIWQGHDKGHEWNASFPTMSSGDLPALISKWLKKREKYSRQRFLWTLCRSVVPWRCTTRFRPAGDGSALLSDTLSPTRQWGREKSAPSTIWDRSLSLAPQFRITDLSWGSGHAYIWQCNHFIFHVVCFEVWACARAKTI